MEAQRHVRQALRVVGHQRHQLSRANALTRFVGQAQGLGIRNSVKRRAYVHGQNVKREEVVVG